MLLFFLFSVNILKSPLKTNSPRKRKVPKTHLNWNTEMTDAFLSECALQKKDVQKDNIPINAWKLISAGMEENRKITVGWNHCRDKFTQMNEFFRSMLPSEGFIAGKKWPFYERFCGLFDIPTEYQSLLMLSAEDGDGEEDDDGDADPAERKYRYLKFYLHQVIGSSLNHI